MPILVDAARPKVELAREPAAEDEHGTKSNQELRSGEVEKTTTAYLLVSKTMAS